MNQTQTPEPVAQLAMSGTPEGPAVHSALRCCDVASGSTVVYVGNVSGGPRYGMRGTVKQTLARRAIVDMGRLGSWHIPYYLLAVMDETLA